MVIAFLGAGIPKDLNALTHSLWSTAQIVSHPIRRLIMTWLLLFFLFHLVSLQVFFHLLSAKRNNSGGLSLIQTCNMFHALHPTYRLQRRHPAGLFPMDRLTYDRVFGPSVFLSAETPTFFTFPIPSDLPYTLFSRNIIIIRSREEGLGVLQVKVTHLICCLYHYYFSHRKFRNRSFHRLMLDKCPREHVVTMSIKNTNRHMNPRIYLVSFFLLRYKNCIWILESTFFFLFPILMNPLL